MSLATLNITLAQVNCRVGDIAHNTRKIVEAAQQAAAAGADLVLFPELSITGYPPEDLLLHPELQQRVQRALQHIMSVIPDIHIVIGHPDKTPQGLYNAASVLYAGKLHATYHKQHIPNYGVFDEKRYFQAGSQPTVISVKGFRLALTICEDLWQAGPLQQAMQLQAEAVLCLNASPYDFNKSTTRQHILRTRQQQEGHLPIIYVNLVGGQDELVFDGGSMVIDKNGKICQRLPLFQESLTQLRLVKGPQGEIQLPEKTALTWPSDIATLYQALVLGTHDYWHKNGFPSAVLGLSGGIDSALTLAIACDAIGADKVYAVSMPSRYTLPMSIEDAQSQAKALGAHFQILSIEDPFRDFLALLAESFKGTAVDSTEENLQSRCRGTLLMALSNKFGHLVLTTGNKSEMAVGYSTLYGDMAGGFAILKDVPKTWVYRLAEYRNQQQTVIPQRVLKRPPSAELAAGQTDQDSLPPYPILDEIIRLVVEENYSVTQIIQAGFAETTVIDVIKKIERNQYKRHQAPPGIRITPRAFGRDWRYPITSGFGLHRGDLAW